MHEYTARYSRRRAREFGLLWLFIVFSLLLLFPGLPFITHRPLILCAPIIVGAVVYWYLSSIRLKIIDNKVAIGTGLVESWPFISVTSGSVSHVSVPGTHDLPEWTRAERLVGKLFGLDLKGVKTGLRNRRFALWDGKRLMTVNTYTWEEEDRARLEELLEALVRRGASGAQSGPA